MKKMWNTPDIQELTIQSTAYGWGQNGYYKPHRPCRPGKPSYGNDDLCRCEGGTSPCSKHHGSFPGPEDEIS